MAEEETGIGDLIALYGPGMAMYYLAKKVAEAAQARNKPATKSTTARTMSDANPPRMQTQMEADVIKRRRALGRAYRTGYKFGQAAGLSDAAARKLADMEVEKAMRKIEGQAGDPRMTRPLVKTRVAERMTVQKHSAPSRIGDVGLTALLGYESLKLGKTASDKLAAKRAEKQGAEDQALIDLARERYVRERFGQ